MVAQFMRAMHRYDAGRTLPLLHAAAVTTPQLAVLEFARSPRLVSEVADHLGLSRPATSQLVDKLARRGLVRRMLGTEDRRERHVITAAKGRGLLVRVTAARAARFHASLAAIPRDLAERLAAVLAEVVTTLERSP